MSKTKTTFKIGDKVNIKESLYPDDTGIILSVSYRAVSVKWSNGSVGIYSFENNTIEKA